MKHIIPKDIDGIFGDVDGNARIDSLTVAKVFKKPHKNILRDIKNLNCPDDFNRLNFELIYYRDSRNRRKPCYAMTKDGFTLLTMSYNGKKATLFKIAYIEKFNEMEKRIKELQEARVDFAELREYVKMNHDNPKPYHFSNECNMLNKIVLGMTAKQFRKKHNIPDNMSIRPYLTKQQLQKLKWVQNIDKGLLLSEQDMKRRKDILQKQFEVKFA